MEEFCNAKEVAELADGWSEEEAGRRLFEIVAACRETGIDPEAALRRFAGKMEREVEERVGAGTG